MTPPASSIATRLGALDWGELERSLWDRGYATTRPILSARDCADLIRLYPDPARFRKRVDMKRHRFGEGEYRYFARPLPRLVQDLRTHAYRRLAPIANRFQEALRRELRFPPHLRGLLERGRAAGQTRPTPLLFRYQTDGYNCLHRDLYGEVWFPLQAAILLSRPGNGSFAGVTSAGRFIRQNRDAMTVAPDAGSSSPIEVTGLGVREEEIRCYVRSPEDVIRLIAIASVALVHIALAREEGTEAGEWEFTKFQAHIHVLFL